MENMTGAGLPAQASAFAAMPGPVAKQSGAVAGVTGKQIINTVGIVAELYFPSLVDKMIAPASVASGPMMSSKADIPEQVQNLPDGRPCGWPSPVLEYNRGPESLDRKRLLLLADKDISRFAEPGGVELSNCLQQAYAEGIAISMPGARQTLADARELIDQLSGIRGISPEDYALLGKLMNWIQQADQCGCLHDTTEQICFCLSLVRVYFARRYEYSKLGDGRVAVLSEIPAQVSLADILAMPWEIFQSDQEQFLQAYQQLGVKTRSDINSESGCFVQASKWPRLCTFQPLDIDFFVSLMGQKVVVVGFLKKAWELHDRRNYTSNSMPRHDLVHARVTIDLWLILAEILPGRDQSPFSIDGGAHYKTQWAKSIAFMQKQDPSLEVGEGTCAVMLHLAQATVWLQHHLKRLSQNDRKLCNLMLFEFYHETTLTTALRDWLRSFADQQPWRAISIFHKIIRDLQWVFLKKYTCGSVTDESQRIEQAFNTIPDTYRSRDLDDIGQKYLLKEKRLLPAGVCVAQAFVEEVRDSYLQQRPFDAGRLPLTGQTVATLAREELNRRH